jgi:hypothetical protein
MVVLKTNSLKHIAAKRTHDEVLALKNFDHDRQVHDSISYLSSNETLESIETDAYWPKWASPWWQMLLLHEMGLTSQIPGVAVDKIVHSLKTSYLTFFPFKEEDVPEGFDPLMHVPCHCQLGTMHQLLTTYGINVDEHLPWLRPWYSKYQMDDGGLNCDEAAYLRQSPKSSVVSTLPPLEAVLRCSNSQFSDQEKKFLDNGAGYLIGKRLFRKTSNGEPMDAQWLGLCFPRFYHYDILRGLSFVLEWSRTFQQPLPVSAVEECIEKIDNAFPDGQIKIQRAAWAGANSRYFDKQSGSWTKAAAASYPLLDAVGAVGSDSPHLSKLWENAKLDLLEIIEQELLIG